MAYDWAELQRLLDETNAALDALTANVQGMIDMPKPDKPPGKPPVEPIDPPPVEPIDPPPVDPPPVAASAFWTVFTATEPSGEGAAHTGTGTRKIYVAAGGSDNNPGTEASPKKTIRSGVLLLRKGSPDWLLFKKGDTWTDEAFGNLSGYSGLSPEAPMLFSSYGTGKRPLFRTHTDDAMGFYSDNANNVAVVGLEFYAYKRDPDSPDFDPNSNATPNHGFTCNAPTSHLLIEDCKFAFYGDNVVVQGTTDVFKFRRNVSVNSYMKSHAHSQGLYLAYIANATLEENIFDGNGWNEKVGGEAAPTIFNRNVYINQSCGPATVKGNFFARSSSEGMQLRSGGVMKGNFCYENTVGFDVGHQLSEPAPTINSADVTDNVVMHSLSGKPGRNGGGITVLNAKTDGIQIHDNIISQDDDMNDPPVGFGFFLDPDVEGIVLTENIVFAWKDDIIIQGSAGNTLEPNVYDLEGTNTEGYSDPERDLGDYYEWAGGSGSIAEFYAAIRNQSKDTWDDRLTAKAIVNYIRAGFDMAAI